MSPDDVVVPMAVSSVEDALYRLLEAELARVGVFRAAGRSLAGGPQSAVFEAPLEEAELHVAIAHSLLDSFGLDPEVDVVSRLPIRTLGRSLVVAIEQALALLDEEHVWLTIGECVAAVGVPTERCWSRVARFAELTQGEPGDALRAAAREIGTRSRVPLRVRAAARRSTVRAYVLRSGIAEVVEVAPARSAFAREARPERPRRAPRPS